MTNERLKKLKIEFPKHWVDVSVENPDGPPTFIDDTIEESGVLQISIAEYYNGKFPNPSHETLMELSESIGLKNRFGELQRKKFGDCKYGKYGIAEFSTEDFPFISVWHLSNGKDFIFSTFICSKEPTLKQLNDLEHILTSIKKRKFLFF